jgi:phenylacetate-CoA ligase
LYNKKLYNAIKEAQSIQYKSKSEIEAIQQRKFKKLIDHAKLNVPYYKDKLRDVETIEDLKKVDFLTKDLIRQHTDALKAKNIETTRFISNSTSGSTGENMHFFSDIENFYLKAVNIRADEWAGLSYGSKAIYLWGAERDIDKNKSLYLKFKHRFIVKNKILSAYYMSDDDLIKYINIYNHYEPKVVISYPTPLYRFADYVEKHGVKIWKPKGLITSAETLFPFQREKIEQVFHTKIFNRYGCREVGHIASECEKHEGLHINNDRFVVEIVDANGNLCKPGELGEIVITDLDNVVFPLIRYKIGDLGALSEKECTCVRGLPMLEKVEGRVFDLIIGANGNFVAGTFWTLLRNKIDGFKKFQVIQEELTKINILVEDNEQIKEDFDTLLTSFVKEKLGKETIVAIEKVDTIPLTKSGKHRWIISKISPYAK